MQTFCYVSIQEKALEQFKFWWKLWDFMKTILILLKDINIEKN